jgi:hypothetical protein
MTYVVGDGNPDGTTLGSAITEKVSLYGVTPVAQRSDAAQAAVVTTVATSTSPWGFSTSTQANALVTLANELRTALVELGAISGS